MTSHVPGVQPLALNEAIRLARGGFHVGITSPGQKRPHPVLMAKDDDGTKGGVWKSTLDIITIESWWHSCPDGGVTVAPRGHLVALDIDNPVRFEECVGFITAQQLQANYPCTQTPSGGRHIWFQLPVTMDAKLLPRTLEFGEFIYEGFYALVPPSTALNKNHEIGSYTAISALPDQIDQVPVISDDHLDRVLHTAARIDTTVEKGHRHNELVRVGKALVRAGVADAEIKASLTELNASFMPPMEPGELQKDIDGIVRWLAEQSARATTTNSTAPKVEFLSMRELAELPAPHWLIPGLIPDNGLGVLIGAPGGGKSFFLLTLAMSVCQGIPLFGACDLMPTRVGWALALLPEAAGSWGTRIKAYRDYHGVDYCDDFVCCIQQNDLADPATWEHVLAAVQEQVSVRGMPPALVIVDTLSASIPGHDENSQAEMTLLMTHLQGLVAMGACVIVAHHTTKYTSQYRGSSALLGNCDWMISVRPFERGCEFQAVKLRDAVGIDSKGFKIISHGDSAVCVGLTEPGPWGNLDSVSKEHPGLRQALMAHGFMINGEASAKRPTKDICADGVSLKDLQSTWNSLDPIVPTNADDHKGYKAVHGTRATALLNLAIALNQGGVLEVIEGELSRSTRSLTPIVRQVLNAADE